MKRLKSFGIGSVAYQLALTYALFGLVFGAIISLFVMFSGESSEGAGPIYGIGAVVLMPLFYGVIGAIGGAFGAWIYNLVSKITGGISIKVEDDL